MLALVHVYVKHICALCMLVVFCFFVVSFFILCSSAAAAASLLSKFLRKDFYLICCISFCYSVCVFSVRNVLSPVLLLWLSHYIVLWPFCTLHVCVRCCCCCYFVYFYTLNLLVCFFCCFSNGIVLLAWCEYAFLPTAHRFGKHLALQD